MTTNTPKASRGQFTADLEEFRVAQKALNSHDHHTHPDDTNALFEACALAEEKLLAQPAPDVGAVADKLTVLWADAIWSELQEGEQMRQILGDLRRLAE